MVETITPVVYGARRKWFGAVVLMTVGATGAAALFGAALGATGRAFGAPWGTAGFAAVAAVAAAYALREIAGAKIPVLQARRQVPEWWRTYYSPPVAALLYGTGLGIGFFTYLTYGTLVAVAMLALAGGSPLLGVVVLAPFGLARALTVIVVRNADSGEALTSLVHRLAALGRARRVSVGNALALSAMAGLAVVLALQAPRTGIAGFAVAIVALCFGWAAAAKVIRWRRWRAAVEGYGIGDRIRGPASAFVPATEALVPILALVGQPRPASALALALLLVFSAITVRAGLRAGDGRLACGCFGSGVRRDYRWMLARNAGLAGCAVIGLTTAPAGAPPSLGTASGVPVVLTVLGLAVSAWAVRSAVGALRGGRA